ncbi:MAG: hypothetical protein MR455_02105 [Prevotella sp.]|nr:hypothetical protein [Prevotella sp.]
MNQRIPQHFQSLDDLQLKKEEIRAQIRENNVQIQTMWQELFPKQTQTTPTSKWSNAMTKGFGVVDGAILGWKIYRKFWGKKPQKKKKKGFLSSIFG